MQIWVTLLTIAGALGGTWLGTWLVGRQAAKDLRANISREIEILSKLRPESDEARLLDGNIRKNVSDLVAQDDLRRYRARQDTSVTWTLGFFSLMSMAVGLMASWRTNGFWPPLRSTLEGIYWGMWLFYALLLVRVLWIVLSWTKVGVKIGAVWVRVGWKNVRIGWLTAKLQTMKTLVMMPLLRVAEEIMANAEATDAWHTENDGKAITPEALRQRDELMAQRKKLSAKGKRRASLARVAVRRRNRERLDGPRRNDGPASETERPESS